MLKIFNISKQRLLCGSFVVALCSNLLYSSRSQAEPMTQTADSNKSTAIPEHTATKPLTTVLAGTSPLATSADSIATPAVLNSNLNLFGERLQGSYQSSQQTSYISTYQHTYQKMPKQLISMPVVSDWRDANAKVQAIGGWMFYASEVAVADADDDLNHRQDHQPSNHKNHQNLQSEKEQQPTLPVKDQP
jgi:hypothetical protein